MDVKVRIKAIRLYERIHENPELAEKIGLSTQPITSLLLKSPRDSTMYVQLSKEKKPVLPKGGMNEQFGIISVDDDNV